VYQIRIGFTMDPDLDPWLTAVRIRIQRLLAIWFYLDPDSKPSFGVTEKKAEFLDFCFNNVCKEK
jgi:hypothetical protein